METDRKLEKARLIQIEWGEDDQVTETSGGTQIEVQFNPATLKVTYANQVQTNDQSQSSATQYVGRGSSKMSLELVFDLSMPFNGGSAPNDVRAITEQVFNFIKPIEQEGEGDNVRYAAPGIRFKWGTFWFDGIVESMDETLELWSEDGRPLRAVVNMSLSQQGIVFHRENRPGQSTGGPATAGTRPLAAARSGDSVQSMAARAGRAADWKAIAQANGIVDPRRLAPGQLIDVKVKVKVGRG